MTAFQISLSTGLLFFAMYLSSSIRTQNITARCEQEVILPCLGSRNSCLRAVEWSRPDSENYIYLNRDGHSEAFDQERSYVNRVMLKHNGMKDGDVSLVLRNVTVGDTGTYECRCYNLTDHRRKNIIRNKPICIIHLTVRASGGDERGGDKREHVGLIVTLLVAGLLVVVVGVSVIYKKCKGITEQNSKQAAAKEENELQPL